MRRVPVCLLLIITVLGCQRTWQGLQRDLDQYPPGLLYAVGAAEVVLARHYVVTNVDRVHGIVEASSIVKANLVTKHRAKAVARVFQINENAYDVEVRVTNELELSEASPGGRGQPPHDWRAVGFDHVAEAMLMGEVQAQLRGQAISVTPKSTHVLFRPVQGTPARHRDIVPPATEGGPLPAPLPKPLEPTPETAPKPTSSAPAKPQPLEVFAQHVALGDAYAQRRELDKALLEYQRAAVACPQSPVSHLALAGVLTGLRRYDAAAASLREAAAAAKGARLANADLARLRGGADELSERLLLLKGWCKQRPDDASARLLLAYHLFLAGRPDEARAAVGEIMAANPKDAAAQCLVAQMDALKT